jgi:hypothetical protein
MARSDESDSDQEKKEKGGESDPIDSIRRLFEERGRKEEREEALRSLSWTTPTTQ